MELYETDDARVDLYLTNSGELVIVHLILMVGCLVLEQIRYFIVQFSHPNGERMFNASGFTG
jgi:hypothetical protein